MTEAEWRKHIGPLWWRGDVDSWEALLASAGEPLTRFATLACRMGFLVAPPSALPRASRTTAPVAWSPGQREAKQAELGRRYVSQIRFDEQSGVGPVRGGERRSSYRVAPIYAGPNHEDRYPHCGVCRTALLTEDGFVFRCRQCGRELRLSSPVSWWKALWLRLWGQSAVEVR